MELLIDTGRFIFSQEAQKGDGLERVVGCSSTPFLERFQSREGMTSDKMAGVKDDTQSNAGNFGQELPTLHQQVITNFKLFSLFGRSCT